MVRRDSAIILYTSSGCLKCATLKAWLNAKGASFEERSLEDVNVIADLIMRDVYILSAPALEVNGRVYAEKELFLGDELHKGLLTEILKGAH